MGAVINAAVVIIGGITGMLAKGGLPLHAHDLPTRSPGLCTSFTGTSGAISAMMQMDGTRLQMDDTPLLIYSLGTDAVARELLRLEDRMKGLTHRLQSMAKSRDDRFVEGFMSNALVIRVGAMVVVGALQDGLTHDASTPITKVILDDIISMVFASALGIGVVSTAVLLFLYQGAITILAGTLSPLFSDMLIRNLPLIGNVLIFSVGINLPFGRQMKIGSLLPALLILVVWEALQYLVSGMR